MSQKLRILHIEDSSIDAELVRRFLIKNDFHIDITVVETLDEFTRSLAENKPDIILSDYKLPGASGEEFLKTLRQIDQDLPFIFVTGAVGEEKVSDLIHEGANDYVMKDRLHRLPLAIRGALLQAEKRQKLIAAEKALAASEERFRSLVETTSDLIWEMDATGVFQYVSPQTPALYGYDEKEIVGKSPVDFVDEAEAKRVSAILAGILEKQQPFYLLENVVQSKDGNRVVLETSGQPFFDNDNKFMGYRGIARDITSRIKSELELRDSEKRYRLLTETSLDGVWDWDLHNQQLYLSPQWKKQLGYEDHELENHFETWKSHLHPEDKDRVLEHLNRYLKAPDKIWHETFRLRHRDGSYRWLMARATPVLGADGTVSRLFGVHIDINDYKHAEWESAERVKELECLYKIQKDLEPGVDFDFMAQRVVDYLLPALQFPNNTFVRLSIDGKNYHAGKPVDVFSETLSAEVYVNGGKRGEIAVFNHEPRGFLLPEEQQLIDNIARILGRWLERELALDNLKLFERIVSNTQDMMSFVTPDYKYLLVNQAYADRHNLSIKQIQGKSVAEINGQALFEKVIKPKLDQCMNQQRHISYQEAFVMGNITYVMDVRYEPYLENEMVKGAVVSVRDISELATAHKAIKLEAKRARALLELPALAEEMEEKAFMQKGLEIAEQLTKSKISFIHFVNHNERDIELVTWSKSTLDEYCHAVFDNHYPVDKAGIWADSLRQKEPVTFNNYQSYPHKQGLPDGHAELERLITVPVIENGFTVMIAGVGNRESEYTDSDIDTVQLIANEIWRIVQRQRYRDKLEIIVEERTSALADAMRRFTMATEATSIGIWEYILETESMVWDHWMFRLYEMPPGQFNEKLQDWERCLHPDDHDYAMQQLTTAINDKTVLDMSFRIITPIGNMRYIQAKANVICDESGKVIKVLGTNLDVSAHYELNESLKLAVEVAEAANQSKSVFLANMSHEIRTPLNAILGLTYLLQNDNSLKSKALAQIRQIETSGKHLLALINDILDLSKIDSGKLELESVAFNIKAMTENIALMMQDQALSKGLSLIVEAEEIPCDLIGDPTRMNQILLNLVGNAIKFTDKGHVKIKSSCHAIENGKANLRFEIIDTGIGIPRESYEQVFQAFKQADSSTTRKYGGTGLGLAVCQKLVDEMDGKIGFESEQGKGSLFWVEIELGISDVAVAQRAANIKIANPKALLKQYRDVKILLVEDDPVNQEVAKGLLEAVGVSIDIAGDGLQAVNRVRDQHGYHLILMDLQMPVMDGYQATRKIRELKSGAKLPILAMTANAFTDNQSESFEAGMNDFISKPVDPEKFYQTLLKWLPEDRRDPGSKSENGSSGMSEAGAQSDTSQMLKEYFSSSDDIDIQQGLKALSDNMEHYVDLLKMFIKQHQEDSQQLEDYLLQRKWALALQISHKAKGAAGTLGLKKLQAHAAKLEELCRLDEFNSEMNSALISFKESFSSVEAILGNMPQTIAQPGAESLENVDVTALLEELRIMLNQGNTVVLKLFKDNEKVLESTFGSEIDKMREDIQGFDFESALSDIESFIGRYSKNH